MSGDFPLAYRELYQYPVDMIKKKVIKTQL